MAARLTKADIIESAYTALTHPRTQIWGKEQCTRVSYRGTHQFFVRPSALCHHENAHYNHQYFAHHGLSRNEFARPVPSLRYEVSSVFLLVVLALTQDSVRIMISDHPSLTFSTEICPSFLPLVVVFLSYSFCNQLFWAPVDHLGPADDDGEAPVTAVSSPHPGVVGPLLLQSHPRPAMSSLVTILGYIVPNIQLQEYTIPPPSCTVRHKTSSQSS